MSAFTLDDQLQAVWDGSATRVCQQCGGEFPETLERFELTGAGYMRRRCRQCVGSRKHKASLLGSIEVEPLKQMLERMLQRWYRDDLTFYDFADYLEVGPRQLYRILHENRHVQFDVADRILCNTPYSIHDLYPEYCDE